MKLSIIIVNYNTFQLTCNTINSVIETLKDDIEYEIMLVDNHSAPDVVRQLKETYASSETVHLILNRHNLGFSKANNIGIKHSKGEYILLLNSDTVVQENCIQKSLAYIQSHPEIGALGCKLLLGDGSLDHACKRGFPTPEASFFYFTKLNRLFPHSPRMNAYTLGYQDIDAINEVDSLTGAFMLMPRSVIDEVGMLDEDFFMYGEDIDWCYRFKEAGYQVIYYPEAVTIHLKGQSSKKRKPRPLMNFIVRCSCSTTSTTGASTPSSSHGFCT